jgi:hypothetical protein
MVLYFIVGARSSVRLIAVGHRKSLHRLRKPISCHLTLTDVEKLNTSVNARTNYLKSHNLHLRNGVLKSFDNLDWMVGVAPIVPDSD